MTVGERIRAAREHKGMTQEDVAKKIGVATQTIHKYETGIVTNIPLERIEAIAAYLEVTPSHLMGWNTIADSTSSTRTTAAPLKPKKIPILGEIACGKPIFATENRENYLEIRSDLRADFCLVAKGDSMIGARILDGDIVFIRKQEAVNNGEIAAVIIEDEATLKRVYYYPEQGKLILQAENPKYEPFVYLGEELNQIKILGKAVAFQSNIR